MKPKRLILACLAALLAGCQNYRGLIPDKNVRMKGVLIQAGPMGATIRADEIVTTMGDTPLPADDR